MNTPPTMHADFPIGTRVRLKSGHVPQDANQDFSGEIVGISSVGISYVYIILLNSPTFNGHRAISYSGCGLEIVWGVEYV